MSNFGYDVKELIESIKVRCLVPLSQQTFLEEDLLRFANEEMEMKMVPNIIKVKEEFYVKSDSFDLQSNTTNKFEIPYRAIGSKLRNVQYTGNGSTYVMTRIQPEEIPYFENGSSNTQFNSFYMEGNYVVLSSQFSANAGSIKLSYHLKPNKLVDSSRVGIISIIDRIGDGTTGSVTLDNLAFPSNLTAATLADFLQVKPGFRTYSYDIAIQNVNPTTNQVFFLLTDIPDDLVVGDNVATAGECIVPQLPTELHPMLAQCVACRLLEAMGDDANLKRANEKLVDMEKNLFALIDQRTEGNPQKVNNLRSAIRLSKIGYRNYGGYGS